MPLNSYNSPDIPTIGNIRDRIPIDEKIPAARRVRYANAVQIAIDHVSSVLAARNVRTPVDLTAFNSRTMRKLLGAEAIRAMRLDGDAAKRFRSDIEQLARHVGMERRRGLAPLSADLTDARVRLVTLHQKSTLPLLLHFLAAQDWRLSDMCQEGADAFNVALLADWTTRDPAQRFRDTVMAWNHAARTVTDWPQVFLRAPKRRQRLGLPFTAFPPSLELEITTFLNRGNLVDPRQTGGASM